MAYTLGPTAALGLRLGGVRSPECDPYSLGGWARATAWAKMDTSASPDSIHSLRGIVIPIVHIILGSHRHLSSTCSKH